MLTLRRLGCIGLAAVLGTLAFGCGGQDVNSFLNYLVNQQGLGGSDTSVTIRIVNQTIGLDERLTLEIDGEEEVLTCAAEFGACEYQLDPVPASLRALLEERFDEEGGFRGARILDGQPGFSFTDAQYSAESTIVFLLGEDSAEAMIL